MDPMMAVQASANEWAGISSAASGGQLKFEPSAAQACVAACQAAVDKLSQAVVDILRAARGLEGAGVWPSGQQLGEKFVNKVAIDPNSAVNVLQAHIDVLNNMATTFSTAAKHYESTDVGTANSFGEPH